MVEETPEVEIEIRPIDPIEYETAAELVTAHLGEYDAYDFNTDTHDLVPDRMEDLYEEPKGQFWVAVTDDTIVGTIGLRRVDDRICQLVRLSVHPDYRRHDVVQHLLEAFEDYAREAGYRRVTAQTTARQKPAAVFLETSGYSEFKRSLRDKNVVITFEKTL
jgi:N-acetylglutamate synthase-like GNAT family acetyltransferase